MIAVPIGIDTSVATEYELLTPETIVPPSPRREAVHKGLCGHVFVVGGSRAMPGAPELAAMAALRAGAGLVSKAQLLSVPRVLASPEIMLEVVDDRARGFLGLEEASQLIEAAKSCSALIIGPGLGREAESAALVIRLLTECRVPTVLDADGLNILAPDTREAVNLEHCVITPHPGEAARLLGASASEVQRDRYSAAVKLGALGAGAVVLKGAASIVRAGNAGFVNSTGNPYMATAGSGDVLSGIIAALLAQGLTLQESAKSGVFLHGLAGDLAHQRSGSTIIAGDIIGSIPAALASFRTEEKVED